MSRWLALFRETNADIHGRAISANSANRSDEGAFGTNGTIGTGSESKPQAQATRFAAIPEPGPGAEAQLWLDWYMERCAIREYEGGYPRAMAEALTYGEAINRWHRLYGPQPEPAFCAGCGSLLSGSDVLALPDGARVHVDGEWSCLRAYGKRWRAEATKALAVMGIMLPDDPGQL